jgi:plastocyanin
MRLRRALPLLLILAIFSLAACGDDSDTEATTDGGAAATEEAETTAPTEEAESGNEPAPSGEAVRSAKVEIVDFAYDPDPVTIQAGGKVTWINRDSAPHTATADDGSFDTGDLEEGKLRSQSFKTPGSFSYYCEIHPDMTGTVEVVEAG